MPDPVCQVCLTCLGWRTGGEIASRVLFLLTIPVAVMSETPCFPWECHCSSDIYGTFSQTFAVISTPQCKKLTKRTKRKKLRGNIILALASHCVATFPQYFSRVWCMQHAQNYFFNFTKKLKAREDTKRNELFLTNILLTFILRSNLRAVNLWNTQIFDVLLKLMILLYIYIYFGYMDSQCKQVFINLSSISSDI